MKRSKASLVVALLLAGCNSGSSTNKPHANPTGSNPTNNNPTGNNPTGNNPTPTTPPPRLTLTDPGVQTGLQLLRAEITPAQAVTAWQTAGVTPAEAKDLLARLPLTAAFGPGLHQSTIVDAYGRTTDITVSVPATPPPAAGYPVVVFLHGLGGNSGHLANTAALLPDWIVVGPTAQPPPATVTYEDEPATDPFQGQFQHWWVYTDHAFAMRALDWVRERYEVNTDRIILEGASMGGFGTWNLGLRFHDRFAALVSAAGGISRLEYAGNRDANSRLLLENAVMVKPLFAHGDQDQIVPVIFSQWTAQDLTAAGTPHEYRELAGVGHDADDFDNNTAFMADLQAFIDAAVRDSSPTTVVHRAIGDYHPGAYWAELEGPSGMLTATAAGSTITVVTAGAATGATIFLDPNVVDVTQTVTVTVDGQTTFQANPVASLEAVARSFARTRDPRLTYIFLAE
jgi:predicted esterase